MALNLPGLGGVSSPPPVTRPAVPNTGAVIDGGSPQETVTLGNTPAEELTYSNPRARLQAERPDLATMLAESDRKVEEFMAYLRPLLEEQGLAIDKVMKGEQKLTVDAATIDKARADISEEGELGVRKVAERILNFAKFGIGDDPEKIETFRAAIQKGFDEAQAMLGGTLPDISQQTHKAIMAELDNWKANGIPAGTVSLARAQAGAAGA